jgi:hypothetical protein
MTISGVNRTEQRSVRNPEENSRGAMLSSLSFSTHQDQLSVRYSSIFSIGHTSRTRTSRTEKYIDRSGQIRKQHTRAGAWFSFAVKVSKAEFSSPICERVGNDTNAVPCFHLKGIAFECEGISNLAIPLRDLGVQANEDFGLISP